MPHLQVRDQTARKAHAAALQRSAGLPTAQQYRDQLEAAHTRAKARAAEIAAREPQLISIYDLGEVIARIEDEAQLAAAALNMETARALQSAIRQIKTLLP